MSLRSIKKKNKEAQDKFIEEVKQNTQDYNKDNPVNAEKPASSMPSWNELKDNENKPAAPAGNSYAIIAEEGNKVATSTNPDDEKRISGVARHPTYEDLANANVNDWYYGKDNKLHQVTQQDIDWAKMMLAKKEAAPGDEISDNPNTPGSEGDGGFFDKHKQSLADLDSKKADSHAEYTGIPVSDNQGNIQGYTSSINDAVTLSRANEMVKEARANDPVRKDAESSLEEVEHYKDIYNKAYKDYSKIIKKGGKDLTKNQNAIEKALAKTYQAKMDEASNKINEINQNFLDTYGVSLEEAKYGESPEALKSLEEKGIDINALREVAGENINEIAKLTDSLNKTQEEFDYIMGDMGTQVDDLLNGKLSEEDAQAVLGKLEEISPQLKENLIAQLNLEDKTLDSLGEAIKTINDPDLTELYENLKGMTTGLIENKIDFTDPKTIDLFNEYIDGYEDIIKNQELYDQDTRYANDLKLSAFNRLLFNIFDQIKTAIVFIAAIETGNPQLVRSSIDEYNYKLHQTEGKRKVDEYDAYTQNKLREVTQDNIARFKQITEIDPEIAKLEKVLNIQEGEAGKRQMDSLEAAFNEYNKYKADHPGEAADFAAWIAAHNTDGGIAGQIISALLTNFPDLKKFINKMLSGNGGVSMADIPAEGSSMPSIFGNKNSKTSSILDGAVSKLSQSKEPESKPDPALRMDMQNTVGQALASRQPVQGSAPQGQQLNTKTGFGRTV